MGQLTSGKAVAALGFAIIGYFAAEFYQQLLSDIEQNIWISPAAGALGFVIGWRVLGDKLNTDLRSAARWGFGTSVWFFIWADVLFSSAEMIQRSMTTRNTNAGEAIGQVFGIMMDYATLALDIKIIGILCIGGMAAGILAELADRRWH